MEETKKIKSWEHNLFKIIKDISDNDFQNQVWLGNDPTRVSSFDEVLCVLFDDNNFVEYTEYYKSTKGQDRLYQLFVELIEMINLYKKPGKDKLILRDPNWIFITNKAKEILPYLNFRIDD